MYQIKIQKEWKHAKNFYDGDIYSSDLIYNSIKYGKMLKNVTRFKLGMNKNGIPQNNISREKYTFLEVLKILDIAEKSKNSGQVNMLVFWQRVEESILVPGRTGQGLRGAYRKFSKLK